MRMSRGKRSALLGLFLAITIMFGSVHNAKVANAATENYYIKINKGTNVVTIYEKDGTAYTAFACSTGYATPVGTFHTMAKYRWWTLDGPTYGQYCTRITGSILFHSVWYYQNRTPNSQSYVQYNKLGTTASHGCCRLTVAASKWIYENCPTGTKVIIFNGTAKDDPLGKPKTIKVSGYMGWDPTDPDSNNPYKTKSTTPKISISSKTLTYGSKFGDGNMSCKDSGGFDITDWVKMSGTVNMKKVGSYKVKYSVIDSFGRTSSKTVTYKVVDKKAATLTGVKSSLTNDLGDSRNLMKGVKAKDAAGVKLTDKVIIYVKTPSADGYVMCEDNVYTFEEAGTYSFKYVIKNPNNGKKTVKKQTIKVLQQEPPTLTSKDQWSTIYITPEQKDLYWDELMNGVDVEYYDGSYITNQVIITITAPSGAETSIKEGEDYLFEEMGEYTLIYTISSPNSNSEVMTTECQRSLVVTDEIPSEDTINE